MRVRPELKVTAGIVYVTAATAGTIASGAAAAGSDRQGVKAGKTVEAKYLFPVRRGKTIVIADRIIYMEKGRIKAEYTHAGFLAMDAEERAAKGRIAQGPGG
ncbi:hypothetical protein P22_1386 [Propionispora sp. 2/2-37]|uniref:hypothetical protein n=1 Tax=Propionispora sp. 2/2-37 TaxID=1677858 RepID=UPI0006BB9688|nr:hypothetical protein [Propionispora sp. 2/2-37]CUH95316.1 hypothetical protein P22_1386 [Propionispora sp. 2/2-37]